MQESWLWYFWEHKCWGNASLYTTHGQAIEVINTGLRNRNAGPDFLHAKIKIGDTLLVGNVEMHVGALEWDAHEHSLDPAYNTVILHVVMYANKDVRNEAGALIPTLVLAPYFGLSLQKKMAELVASEQEIACGSQLAKTDSWLRVLWLDRLGIERLMDKTLDVERIWHYHQKDWAQALFVMIARSMGASVNAEPMEWLASSVDVRQLGKIKDQLLLLEALLFGQAGLLDQTNASDAYTIELKQHYRHLQNKWQIKALNPQIWKYLRLRPGNFPEMRIAQLAALVHRSVHLFSKLQEADILEFKHLFETQASDYWQSHYRLGKTTSLHSSHMGNQQVNTVLINAVAPTLFAYGTLSGKPALKDKALDLLQSIEPEQHHISRQFAEFGLSAKNAFESQALVQSFKHYCIKKRCLECSVGHDYLTKTEKN